MKHTFLALLMICPSLLCAAQDNLVKPLCYPVQSCPEILIQKLHKNTELPTLSTYEICGIGLITLATEEITYPLFRNLFGKIGGITVTATTSLFAAALAGATTERGKFLRAQRALSLETLEKLVKKSQIKEQSQQNFTLTKTEKEQLVAAQNLLGFNHYLTQQAIIPLLALDQQ